MTEIKLLTDHWTLTKLHSFSANPDELLITLAIGSPLGIIFAANIFKTYKETLKDFIPFLF